MASEVPQLRPEQLQPSALEIDDLERWKFSAQLLLKAYEPYDLRFRVPEFIGAIDSSVKYTLLDDLETSLPLIELLGDAMPVERTSLPLSRIEKRQPTPHQPIARSVHSLHIPNPRLLVEKLVDVSHVTITHPHKAKRGEININNPNVFPAPILPGVMLVLKTLDESAHSLAE